MSLIGSLGASLTPARAPLAADARSPRGDVLGNCADASAATAMVAGRMATEGRARSPACEIVQARSASTVAHQIDLFCMPQQADIEFPEAAQDGGPRVDYWPALIADCDPVFRPTTHPRLGQPGVGAFLWQVPALRERGCALIQRYEKPSGSPASASRTVRRSISRIAGNPLANDAATRPGGRPSAGRLNSGKTGLPGGRTARLGLDAR
jgi:hypothetical protein